MADLQSLHACGDPLTALDGAIAPFSIEAISFDLIEDQDRYSIWRSNLPPFAAFTMTIGSLDTRPSMPAGVVPIQMLPTGTLRAIRTTNPQEEKSPRKVTFAIYRNPASVIYKKGEKITLFTRAGGRYIKEKCGYEWDLNGDGIFSNEEKTDRHYVEIVFDDNEDLTANPKRIAVPEVLNNWRRDIPIGLNIKNIDDVVIGRGTAPKGGRDLILRVALNKSRGIGPDPVDIEDPKVANKEFPFYVRDDVEDRMRTPETQKEIDDLVMKYGRADFGVQKRLLFSPGRPYYGCTSILLSIKGDLWTDFEDIRIKREVYGTILSDPAKKLNAFDLRELVEHEQFHIIHEFPDLGLPREVVPLLDVYANVLRKPVEARKALQIPKDTFPALALLLKFDRAIDGPYSEFTDHYAEVEAYFHMFERLKEGEGNISYYFMERIIPIFAEHYDKLRQALGEGFYMAYDGNEYSTKWITGNVRDRVIARMQYIYQNLPECLWEMRYGEYDFKTKKFSFTREHTPGIKPGIVMPKE